MLQAVIHIVIALGLRRLAEQAGATGMSVLNVVDGVLVAARQGQIDIEGQLRGRCAGNQKVASRVAAYPIDQIAKRYIATGPFGQLDLCPLSHDGHHLMQHVLGPPFGDADVEALQTGPHPCDGAVMVRALFIDDSLEAPLPLVVVIRDIGNEVGIATLAFAHDPVLVVTEVGGA